MERQDVSAGFLWHTSCSDFFSAIPNAHILLILFVAIEQRDCKQSNDITA